MNNISVDFIIKILAPTLASIGGLYTFWKYHTERKERLLDSDFNKIQKLLCDKKFKKQMDENHLLRSIYYKNIKYFSGITDEVIDVIIKTQNREQNFNSNFYHINQFYRKNLLGLNNKKDGFIINTEKLKKWRYKTSFVWAMWILYISFILYIAITAQAFQGILEAIFLLIIMVCIQFPLMMRQEFINSWKKFNKQNSHLLDNTSNS